MIAGVRHAPSGSSAQDVVICVSGALLGFGLSNAVCFVIADS